jgi:ribose-phosphate pyrophosphokinase
MNRRIYALPGNDDFADRLAAHGGWARAALEVHRFPDGESLVTVAPPAAGEESVLVCTLDRPDPKLLPLLMAAATLRELGATHVGLVAPYLAYMRQDARFQPGQAISSCIFGRLLDQAFDWLLTVDPHLHRHRTLAEAGMPRGRVAHAAPALATWIREHVALPLIIGPDGESEQWAREVARLADAPAVIAGKERRGDRDVGVALPDLTTWRGRIPVLLDDIIASGHTMAETVRALISAGWPAPTCVAVHGVFAEGASALLRMAGAARVVTTNTIAQASADIDISGTLAMALAAGIEA